MDYYWVKLASMKKVLACLQAGLIVLATSPVSAQFNGRLIYQADKKKGGRVVMTYLQSGNSGRMTGYDIDLKNGYPDTSTMQAQDTILYDFTNANETHLQFETLRAMKMKYMGNVVSALMSPRLKQQSSTTVVNKGADTANGHQCMHFVVTTTSPLNTGIRDIWITTDFGAGVSPLVWVTGMYLYYQPGTPQLQQLTAAGAAGVVVRVIASNPRNGVLWTMNLITYDHPRLMKETFTVPSRYTILDRTNVSIPSRSGN